MASYTRVAQSERNASKRMEPLLTDDDRLDADIDILESNSKSKPVSTGDGWMRSPVWFCSTILLLMWTAAQTTYFWASIASYEGGFGTELGTYLPFPFRNLHR